MPNKFRQKQKEISMQIILEECNNDLSLVREKLIVEFEINQKNVSRYLKEFKVFLEDLPQEKEANSWLLDILKM